MAVGILLAALALTLGGLMGSDRLLLNERADAQEGTVPVPPPPPPTPPLTAEDVVANEEGLGEALTDLATDDPEAAGDLLVAAVGLDADLAGNAFADAAAEDADALGDAFAVAAAQDADAIGELLAVAAAQDAEAVGDSLAVAARKDADATGDVLADAAVQDADAVGNALAVAAAEDAEAVGDALADAAAQDADAMGDALAVAARKDADATGDVLAEAAAQDADAMGDALAVAAAQDADAIGDILAGAAAQDADVIGDAIAAGAAQDADVIGRALGAAAVQDADVIGNAIAAGAAQDAGSIGDAIAAGAALDAGSIGDALTNAIDADPASTAAAVIAGASNPDNTESIVNALVAGPSKDPAALESLGVQFPVEAFAVVRNACSQDGNCAAAWTVLLVGVTQQQLIGLLFGLSQAVPNSTVTLIAAKLTEGLVGGQVSLELVTLPAGIAPPPGVIVNAYYEITPVGFTDEDIVSSEVTFRVSRSWLEENNVHPLAVQFTRYNEATGAWAPVVAKWQADFGQEFQFLANPSSFSLFAIAGAGTVPPPQFQVDNLAVQTNFGGRIQRVLFTASVLNLTDEPLEFNVVLWIDDQAEAAKSFIVGSGEVELIDFVADLGPGTHTVRIDRLTTTFGVGPPTATPVPTSTLVPTLTPVPTSTPVPTATPLPEEPPVSVNIADLDLTFTVDLQTPDGTPIVCSGAGIVFGQEQAIFPCILEEGQTIGAFTDPNTGLSWTPTDEGGDLEIPLPTDRIPSRLVVHFGTLIPSGDNFVAPALSADLFIGPVEATREEPGEVQIRATFDRIPLSLEFNLRDVPTDAPVLSSIRQAVSNLNLNIGLFAYSIVVEENFGEGLISAGIEMVVGKIWADAGPRETVRVLRRDDRGVAQVLVTSFTDEGGLNLTYRAESPRGFSTFTLLTLVPEAPGQDDGGLPWLWTGIGAGIGIVALMAFGSFTFVSMRRGPPPDEEQEEELEYNGEPGSWPPPQAIVEPSEVEGAPGPEPSPS